MINSTRDIIYTTPQKNITDFVFDESVVNVFDDMIKRSVPGYSAVVNMVGCLASMYVQEDSQCYDLGCSLGASTLSMSKAIKKDSIRIIAVDNSKAMVKKCKENISKCVSDVNINVICDDIQNVKIENASMVILNFTLQFIEPNKREELLKKIYDGMLPGGVLLISDKIAFEDKKEQELQTNLHHTFKKLNGYSDLEIAQKRTALENVLIPDTLLTHQNRLSKVGFSEGHVWFQCFNFASMIAFK